MFHLIAITNLVARCRECSKVLWNGLIPRNYHARYMGHLQDAHPELAWSHAYLPADFGKAKMAPRTWPHHREFVDDKSRERAYVNPDEITASDLIDRVFGKGIT